MAYNKSECTVHNYVIAYSAELSINLILFYLGFYIGLHFCKAHLGLLFETSMVTVTCNRNVNNVRRGKQGISKYDRTAV